MTSCNSVSGCPAIAKLDNGDFLVIGTLWDLRNPNGEFASEMAKGLGLNVAPGERAVVVPREVFRAFVEGGAPDE